MPLGHWNTPEMRGAIVALRLCAELSFQRIGELTGLPRSTIHNIWSDSVERCGLVGRDPTLAELLGSSKVRPRGGPERITYQAVAQDEPPTLTNKTNNQSDNTEMSDHEDEEEWQGGADNEPPEVNPYEVLGVDKAASADEIKKAYRKAALLHHPDKATDKDAAHIKFQEIACAYAILSDPIRRKRYDTTGSSADTITDSDGFNWSDFYKEQFKDVVTADSIDKIAAEYKGSEEEKQHILDAYENHDGDMEQVFNTVMLSDQDVDGDRFRAIIEAAIKDGKVKQLQHYKPETAAQKKRRLKRQQQEQKEAEALASELGVEERLSGKKGKAQKSKAKGGMDELAAMISTNRQSKGVDFLSQLEAKYAPMAAKKQKRGRSSAANASVEEEPSEEAFAAASARLKRPRAS